MLDFVNSAFDWLKDYSSSPWFYVVLLSIAFLDSFFPVVPSETMVIIGGVAAGLHELHWSLVIVFAGIGTLVCSSRNDYNASTTKAIKADSDCSGHINKLKLAVANC
jgi:hypothetical protein